MECSRFLVAASLSYATRTVKVSLFFNWQQAIFHLLNQYIICFTGMHNNYDLVAPI